MNKSPSVAIVTGGSGGIGLATARALASKGCRVYELSRTGIDTGAIRHITADVTDESSVISAVKTVADTEGRLDILVACAGYGVSGAAEFTPDAAVKAQFDVNYFGTVRACRAVMPYMRRSNAGRIVCLSSVAGPVAIPFQAHYSASKAAVNAYVMALRSEAAPLGISVCAVLPGDTNTGFTAARNKITEDGDVYSGRIQRSVAKMEKDELSGADPDSIGRFVARAAMKKRVRPMLVPGFMNKLIVMLSRLLPQALVCRIVGIMYAS